MKLTARCAIVATLAIVCVCGAAPEIHGLDFSWLTNRFRNLPDNAKAEIHEEERISEVLHQDANYRQLFQSVSNPDIPLSRFVQPGEDLQYQAKWRGLPAGTVRIAAKRMGAVRGRPVFVFEVSAESNDFMNAFYPVNTSANSYVDAATGRSYLIRRRVSERNRSYKDRLEFKYDYRMPNGLPDPVCRYSVVLADGEEVGGGHRPIPGNMQDMVSVIYYMRGLRLEKLGDSCTILVGGRSNPGLVTLNVVGEETVVTGVGKFDCLIVEPAGDGTTISASLIASRGSERLWLEKHSRIPVMFSAELPKPLGQVVATINIAENCELARYSVR
ncbi:MAG: DUF3108 domain-containing protein [Planctomycetota bacterium]|jgi:hypothetical protein|nr:DUF3108 domain-containing protein [Planctomycetota bacterium]